MKKLIAVLLLASLLQAVQAQENPFEELGYNPKIASLSGGKYIEYFDRDTIVNICGILYNTMSQKIVGFIEEDTLNPEATLQPDIVSRWMSPDPMSYAAPGWTPYRFNFDNPIYFVDPTGLFEGEYYDKDGNWLGSDGIDDDKVYVVEGTSRFNLDDYKEGGKYHENHSDFAAKNGDGFSVDYIGDVFEVFTTGDPASDKRIQSLHPAIRMKTTNFLIELNRNAPFATIRVAQGYRTIEEQDALYAKGRTKSGTKVTNAKGGYSNHNFGLAFDIVGILNDEITYNLLWEKVSELGKEYGFDWGGDWRSFKDNPHFELMYGYSLKELRALPKDEDGYVKLRN